MASEPLLSSSITYPVIRETFHSKLPFETVISNLYSSIGKSDALKWPSIAASIAAYDESSKENGIKEVEAAVGPEGFMNFGASLVVQVPILYLSSACTQARGEKKIGARE